MLLLIQKSVNLFSAIYVFKITNHFINIQFNTNLFFDVIDPITK